MINDSGTSKRKVKFAKPIHDGIIVESFVVSETTKGGLFKPEEVVEKEKATMKDDQYRKVVAVGPECKNVKVGDEVLFGRSTPFNMNFDGVDYMHYFEHQVIQIYTTEENRELIDNSRYISSYRQ
jgi:co-chaperonin GroES (HSP10)